MCNFPVSFFVSISSPKRFFSLHFSLHAIFSFINEKSAKMNFYNWRNSFNLPRRIFTIENFSFICISFYFPLENSFLKTLKYTHISQICVCFFCTNPWLFSLSPRTKFKSKYRIKLEENFCNFFLFPVSNF